MLPAYAYPWKKEIAPAPIIIALNTWMKDYAARVGVTYLDYHSAMRDERGGLLPELTTDGVHVSEKGYRVMSELVQRAIAAALTKPVRTP